MIFMPQMLTSLQSEGPHDDSTKDAWRYTAITKSPTLQFWDMILIMEILGLIFVQANRLKKFPSMWNL